MKFRTKKTKKRRQTRHHKQKPGSRRRRRKERRKKQSQRGMIRSRSQKKSPLKPWPQALWRHPPAKKDAFSPMSTEKYVPDLNPQSLAEFFSKETYAAPKRRKIAAEPDPNAKMPNLERVATVASIGSRDPLSPGEKETLPLKPENLGSTPSSEESAEAPKPCSPAPATTASPAPLQPQDLMMLRAQYMQQPKRHLPQRRIALLQHQSGRPQTNLALVGLTTPKPSLEARCLKLSEVQKSALTNMAKPTAPWPLSILKL